MYQVSYEKETFRTLFETFPNLKEALKFAREIAKEYIDHPLVYYVKRNGECSDSYWVVDPDGKVKVCY